MKLQPFDCHNFISIDFKFGVDDNVREIISADKVGSGPMSGRDVTWEQQFTGPVTFIFLFFFYSSTELQPIPVKQFSRTIAQTGYTEYPFKDAKCVVVKFGSVLP